MRRERVSVTITRVQTSDGAWTVSVRREENGNSHALQTYGKTKRDANDWGLTHAREELLGEAPLDEDDAA